MRAVFPSLLVLALSTLSIFSPAQNRLRTALLPAGGPFPPAEQNAINELTPRLVTSGGVDLVDRQKTAVLLKEQNLQNSDRMDVTSAVRLGKLLNIPVIVFVRVDAYFSDKKSATANGKTTWTGVVLYQESAEIIDVQTGVILADPIAKYDRKNVVLSESYNGQAMKLGPITVPGFVKAGPDPQAALVDLNAQAFTTVNEELAQKMVSALGKVPAGAVASTPAAVVSTRKIPKVAGIQGKMTFLNAGANDALKAGDRFQIVRTGPSGLTDPDTGQPIMRKLQVCVLTISDVEDALASGTCVGAAAQSGDQAIAQR